MEREPVVTHNLQTWQDLARLWERRNNEITDIVENLLPILHGQTQILGELTKRIERLERRLEARTTPR